MVQSINDISAGLGDAFIKDKVNFDGKLKIEESKLRRLLSLF